MRVFVTGASGFVGRHLCRRLAEIGQKVFGATYPGESLTAGWEIPGCKYRPCDVGDFAGLRSALRWARPNWIIHLAAISFSPEAAQHPDETWQTNFGGTLRLYEAVRLSKLKPRVLFVGTSDEYGPQPPERLPMDETCPLSPAGVYGSSKAAADLAGAFFVARHGLDIVRVRPFNHTGPGQSPRFVCSDFARQVAEAALRPAQKRSMLVGNLEVRRDFMDVRDVVRAYIAALEKCPKGEVYNIASEKAVRIGDILQKLIALTGAQIEIHQDPERLRATDPPRIVGDATKFRLATGWRPEIPLDDTLWDLLEYWRAQLGSQGNPT